MKRIHLIVGLFFILFFLGTGMHMRLHLQESYAVNPAYRYASRANHIYILLVALVNLGLGLYMTPREGRWRRTCQNLGSSFVLLSMAILSAAFFLDTANPHRPFTGWGLYFIFAGVLLHLIAAWSRR